MKKNELQSKDIEVLKTFNNSISTSRLYPPEAPQVTAAVDRGYEAMKKYLGQYRQLEFALFDEQPYLCGALLPQEVLDSFPNLHIYRQLKTFGLGSLTVTADMDRFTFKQILGVFQAPVTKINEYGGGLEYITGLGLSGYFSRTKSDTKATATRKGLGKAQQEKNIFKVRPELVLCLLGKDKRPLVIEDLKKRMVVIDSSVSIIAATVAKILQGIRGKKKIIAAAQFPRMLRTAETLMPPEQKEAVAKGLAELLAVHLKDSALCVLLCQDFSSPLAASLYKHVVNGLTGLRIGEVFVVFRQQIARVNSKGAQSPEVRLLCKSLLTLKNTEKGKVFSSAEKNRAIIHGGERKRTEQWLGAGVSSILEGDYQILDNDEFIRDLPEGMVEMHKGPKGECVPKVLKNLIRYLGSTGNKGGGTVLNCLLKIGNNFLESGHVGQVEILAEPLVLVVQRAALSPQRFEDTITFLQKLMRANWKSGNIELGDKILMLFYQLRSGQIGKNNQLKKIVGQVQDRGIDRTSLPLLLKKCLENPKDEALSYRLVLQGPIAIRFLVDALIETEGSIDRLKIIDLLTSNTGDLPAIVKERLPDHMPWFGKRNLIKLLGETGREEDAENVIGFLRHSDYRVQREAFLCIYKIGGLQRKKLFFEALEIASEAISIQIVEAFASFCDEDVASRLAILLKEYTNFSESTREPLLLALLDTLGRCPCDVSLRAVQSFAATKGQKSTKRISKKVWRSADKSLHFLENDLQALKKKHIRASQLRKVALQQLSKKNKAAVNQRVITGLPEEQTIRNLLSRGELKEGIGNLMLLIEQIARKRNFPQAEQLKEWLVDIDPTKMGNVLKAGEIIAKEKITAIDKSHVEVWAPLYDILSTKEFSEVFEHLEHKSYVTEERIVEQGDEQNGLFFVNSGEVKIYFRDRGEAFLIATMKSGEIFGADAFFEPSVWTMSVTSIGDSEISLLPVDVLQRWSKEYPQLEEKLLDFCQRFERVESLIVKSSRDRRVHKRHQVTRQANTSLLDIRGKSTGVTSDVNLLDVSQGGLAYTLTLDHKRNLRQLLGRKVRINLPTAEVGATATTVTGDIVSVKSSKDSQGLYSVHMEFDTLIDKKLLYEIIQELVRE